ncbi:MAG TPA: NACHT domain-containing protein [Schlesneria sp.]|jgi:hypothetical protein
MAPDPGSAMTVASLTTAAAVAAITTAVKRIITDAYEGSKGAAQTQLKVILQARRINKLVKHLTSVRLVKTIWQVDREVDLHEFYYPTSIAIANKTTRIRSLDELSKLQCLVFQGIVGQGKSMFLRHLACQEIFQGKRVPLFVELRRLVATSVVGDATEPTPLLAGILSKLKDLGFDADEDLFNRFAAKGLVVLMLDAFDELADDCIKPVINELESLHQRYPNLQVVVTSRPDSAASRLAMFHVYNVAHVAKDEVGAFVDRLVSDVDLHKHIMGAVEQAPHIHGILVTPLMVTLMVISFRARNSLPESLSGFYENLVPVLLSRHDQTKPGFTRPKTCKLSDHRIRELFEALCFVSKRRLRNKPTMSDREVHECAARAIDIVNFECDESAFVKDIVKVTCLLLEDAGLYSFLHKSVQEFGAASFIKHLSTQSITKIYSEMLDGLWTYWKVELEFLSEIDTYRFDKLYLLKDLERTLGEFCEMPLGSKGSEVTDKEVRNMLRSLFVVEITGDEKTARKPFYYIFPDSRKCGFVFYRHWLSGGLSFFVENSTIESYLAISPRPPLRDSPYSNTICTVEDLLDAELDDDRTIKKTKGVLKQLVGDWNSVITRIDGREKGEMKAFQV